MPPTISGEPGNHSVTRPVRLTRRGRTSSGDQEDVMNQFAAHSLKAAAMIAMAGGAVIGGVAHTSAGAPSTWITANDGCYYLTDDGGQTATEAACPRADGSIDVYVAESGQWLYSQTVGGNVVQQSPEQFDPNLTSSWLDSMSTDRRR